MLVSERAPIRSVQWKSTIYIYLRAIERSERSEHTAVLSLRFLYIYSVTKILHKIRATTFTEKLWKITHEGDERLG